MPIQFRFKEGTVDNREIVAMDLSDDEEGWNAETKPHNTDTVATENVTLSATKGCKQTTVAPYITKLAASVQS